MVLNKRVAFFSPKLPLFSKFGFITIAATIFFNTDLQASVTSFFVHQTVQSTIYLQENTIQLTRKTSICFITEMCYKWLGVHLPHDLHIDKKQYCAHVCAYLSLRNSVMLMFE